MKIRLPKIVCAELLKYMGYERYKYGPEFYYNVPRFEKNEGFAYQNRPEEIIVPNNKKVIKNLILCAITGNAIDSIRFLCNYFEGKDKDYYYFMSFCMAGDLLALHDFIFLNISKITEVDVFYLYKIFRSKKFEFARQLLPFYKTRNARVLQTCIWENNIQAVDFLIQLNWPYNLDVIRDLLDKNYYTQISDILYKSQKDVEPEIYSVVKWALKNGPQNKTLAAYQIVLNHLKQIGDLDRILNKICMRRSFDFLICLAPYIKVSNRIFITVVAKATENLGLIKSLYHDNLDLEKPIDMAAIYYCFNNKNFELLEFFLNVSNSEVSDLLKIIIKREPNCLEIFEKTLKESKNITNCNLKLCKILACHLKVAPIYLMLEINN